MSLVAADWSIDRSNGNIRYIGDDHGGTSPSYATVLELHRWLQDLADDAIAVGDDELDITNLNPSHRSTDNIITLLGAYNIDDATSEHLYDGSIIQDDGDTIYDGIVNFGNSDIVIQIVQNGAILSDDWWNITGGGLNAVAASGISHRFMIKVRVSGSDIDGRRLLCQARTFGNMYTEFMINGTVRGNNVSVVSDSDDINNNTAESTVATWTALTNLSEGYCGIDINNNGVDEYYFCEWDLVTLSRDQFYERLKWLTRNESTEVLYGLNGNLFRGITHQITYSSLTGTFDESNLITWSGASAGTGQVLADNGVDVVWIQLLTGVPPVATCTIAQTSPDAASATIDSVIDRTSTMNMPFIGPGAIAAPVGGYGVGIDPSDLTSSYTLYDLYNNVIHPPNYVTQTIAGLVSGEDRVLVAPWDGTTVDAQGNPAIQKDQLSLDVTLDTDNITSVVVSEVIPDDTPASGYIRVTDDNGFERRLHYSSWLVSTFTIDTTDGNEDFDSVNATAGNNVYIAYIDELASGTTASFTYIHASGTRDLVVLVRDGGATPIKEYISSWTVDGTLLTLNVIRATDL